MPVVASILASFCYIQKSDDSLNIDTTWPKNGTVDGITGGSRLSYTGKRSFANTMAKGIKTTAVIIAVTGTRLRWPDISWDTKASFSAI
ncbi:hypothetical protein Cob_v002310 [Colletotrichum orbiculare MAFF 240422]|uniref:Uncharacterized protein n=1 Tax=Colletotrichum orbiculare (strain 104-T / ATCC 96160 / CBS 514.97 / LARS 414 / MAFF 240422) TaxID=1213857 RepID=A0A484G4W7_COLOR|nr:hypothetical protein Cob_v002310 [Colletotrichum orbiculare MAFF 240422]